MAITRTEAEALIQEQLISTIFEDAPKESSFMSLARRLPNMTSGTTRAAVLSMLPTAYWVEGDTGFKQTSKAAWENVYLNAAELAVIVPIPQAVIDDASFDLISEITPRINEAIGQRVDAAVIFGNGRPAAWQNDIITLARQAGNNVALGASPDYYELLLGDGGVISKIEEDGFMSTGAVASMAMRAKLRSVRTTDGYPIFKADMQGATRYALDGAPLYFPENGSFDASVAQLIVGDWTKAVYALRQDVTVTIHDTGVIQDPSTGNIVYNLLQQDMVAVRVVFRMGWALPNPATALNGDRTGVPFAYLEPATAVTTKTATITVQTGSGQSATAVEGASVNLNGSILKTNASGQVVFNLRAGTYPVEVKATGYSKVVDSVTVASSNVTKTITLG